MLEVSQDSFAAAEWHVVGSEQANLQCSSGEEDDSLKVAAHFMQAMRAVQPATTTSGKRASQKSGVRRASAATTGSRPSARVTSASAAATNEPKPRVALAPSSAPAILA